MPEEEGPGMGSKHKASQKQRPSVQVGEEKEEKKTCAGRRVGKRRVHQRVRITGERYIQYRWQLSDGERRKCIESGSRYTRGGRRSEIGKRDIANKGDIVRDADDSRAAVEPESACDTGSLKPSPALSLPLTSFALPQHLFLLPFLQREDEWRCSIFSPQVPPDRGGIFFSSSFFVPVRMSLHRSSWQSTGDVIVWAKCTSGYAQQKHTRCSL